MKTILVPTDFSGVSKNAVQYAANLAELNQSRLILFHVYQMPVVLSEVPVVITPLDEIEKDCLNELHKIQKQLQAQHNNSLDIDCYCKSGFIVDEIISFAKEIEAELIVTGMQGAGFVTEIIMGSNTTSLIQKSKCPVLAIDKHAKFKKIEKILLACDYEEIKDKSILYPLKELAKSSKAAIHILNVTPEDYTEPTITKAVEGMKIDHLLEGTEHYFHTVNNKDVIDGINEFIKKYAIDITVMIPREHSFLKTLFKETHTKQMAFHTHTPLLTLHE